MFWLRTALNLMIAEVLRLSEVISGHMLGSRPVQDKKNKKVIMFDSM